MERVGLIIGFVLGVFGLYRIDYILWEGLNYFGKYVFFVLFNLAIVYIFYFLYSRFSGVLKIILPIIFGVALMGIGVKIA